MIDWRGLPHVRLHANDHDLLADYEYKRTIVELLASPVDGTLPGEEAGQQEQAWQRPFSPNGTEREPVISAPLRNGGTRVRQETTTYRIKTDLRVSRVGLMLVGWGGNNGSTVTAAILANRQRLQWLTRNGPQQANYFGSLCMASTVKLGVNAQGDDVHVPMHDLLPMVHPNDLVVGGWDISSMNLADAMERACVLEPDLQRQLREEMAQMKPLPSIFYRSFVADNQRVRADNLINDPESPEQEKQRDLERIRADIRGFKEKHQLDKVIVIWTATTERFTDIIPGVHDSADALLAAISNSHEEIAPSTVFAVASILEGSTFINGSPQNTFVPGVLELAERHDVHVGGDDFKSGQTKLKSVLVEFLVGAGMKPRAITSYNHLGNNDGLNLSSQAQFRSKEISKRNVVDDMVDSNRLLYKKNEHPDHTVVIKYVPAVGDSKRAMDEYYTEIFMGGTSNISIHNICEDSLLAAPLILDLAIIAELLSRIQFRKLLPSEPKLSESVHDTNEDSTDYESLRPVLGLLSYFLKAPLCEQGKTPVNALARQRSSLVHMLKACIGLHPDPEIPLPM